MTTREAAGATATDERLATLLQDARQRSDRRGLLSAEIELYCQNSRCVARTVRVVVKEYDTQTPHTLTCPACQQTLKVHQILTFTELHRKDEVRGRQSVNVQMYSRDHQKPDVLSLVPVSVFCDDRLPPTPAGWWNRPKADGQ